jgi:chemotaxis response regulator CheB
VIRVLLADDAADMRLMIRVALETDGRFAVVGDAPDGTVAIDLLESENPDVLILDMAMPKMDGLQVLAEMKERGLAAKVLAFSGFNAAVEKQAKGMGAHDFLRKGTGSISELVPRLLALCA